MISHHLLEERILITLPDSSYVSCGFFIEFLRAGVVTTPSNCRLEHSLPSSFLPPFVVQCANISDLTITHNALPTNLSAPLLVHRPSAVRIAKNLPAHDSRPAEADDSPLSLPDGNSFLVFRRWADRFGWWISVRIGQTNAQSLVIIYGSTNEPYKDYFNIHVSGRSEHTRPA